MTAASVNNFDPRITKSEANVLHSAAVTRDYIAQPRLGILIEVLECFLFKFV